MGWQDSTGAMSSLFPCQSPHRCLHCGFWPHVPGVQERGVWPHRRHGWVFTHHQESFWGTWDLLHKHHPGWWHKPSPCQCPDLCKWRWVHKEESCWWKASPCGHFPAGGENTGKHREVLVMPGSLSWDCTSLSKSPCKDKMMIISLGKF